MQDQGVVVSLLQNKFEKGEKSVTGNPHSFQGMFCFCLQLSKVLFAIKKRGFSLKTWFENMREGIYSKITLGLRGDLPLRKRLQVRRARTIPIR